MSAEAARAILHELLDRIERQSEAERRRAVSRKLPMSFASAAAREAFEAVLRDAEQAGAVTLEAGRGEIAHLLQRVRLQDSGELYRFLDRTPAMEQARAAVARLFDRTAALTHVAAVRDEVAERWLDGRSWMGLGRDDLTGTVDALRALDAVLAGDFARQDMRTVSRKRTGHSKTIERQIGRIARWLKRQGLADASASDHEALATLGLEKYPQDIKLAGRLVLEGVALSELIYVGVPPEAADRIRVERARSLVTIENLVSFNRYVREVRRPEEVVIFTGGFPSRAVGRAIATIAPQVDAVWHWGDIDPAGLRIALVVQEHAGCPVRLWMMTPELARRHGQPSGAGDPGQLPEHLTEDMARLAAFLRSEDAHVLEQEELDPVSPGEEA